jgi:hypothetical protein
LREAQGHIEDGDTIEVTGRRLGGQRSLEIRVKRAPVEMGVGPLASTVSESHNAAEGVRPLASTVSDKRSPERKGSDPLHGRLRIILARLLLEVQGAKLTCTIGEDACWTALIEFPGRG